ncbi:MAG: hypothetical protein ACRDVP_08970 [Acidimicrobiales bacterium]
MSMVCGLDLHRGPITFDALIPESGEVWRGRIWSPDRARLRRWLAEEVTLGSGGGPVDIAVEGCTGWRYVVEEITALGFDPARVHTEVFGPALGQTPGIAATPGRPTSR